MPATSRPAEMPCRVTFWAAVYNEGSKSSRLLLAAMVHPELTMTRKSSKVMDVELKLSESLKSEEMTRKGNRRMIVCGNE